MNGIADESIAAEYHARTLLEYLEYVIYYVVQREYIVMEYVKTFIDIFPRTKLENKFY